MNDETDLDSSSKGTVILRYAGFNLLAGIGLLLLLIALMLTLYVVPAYPASLAYDLPLAILASVGFILLVAAVIASLFRSKLVHTTFDSEPRGNLLGAILCVPTLFTLAIGARALVLDPDVFNAYGGLLGMLVSLITGIVVAVDAGRLGASPLWGLGTFLFMIIVLPIYVFKRPKFAWDASFAWDGVHSSSKLDRPLGKMAKKGCPTCNGPVAVEDESCQLCGANLR